MKKYLAIFLGSEDTSMMDAWNALPEAEQKERERAGMQAWMEWGQKYGAHIVDWGSPLGKTKRVDASGVSDTKNAMGAWCVVQAESHEAAAKLFEDHPHFTIFPGDRVEVMEMLPMPTMQ